MLFSMLASVALSALLALVSVKAERNGLGADPQCKYVDCLDLIVFEPKCASRNDVLWALTAFNSTTDNDYFAVKLNRTENGMECYWASTGVSSAQDYQEVQHLVNLVKDPMAKDRHVYKFRQSITGTTPTDDLPFLGKEPRTATKLKVTVARCAIVGGFGARGSLCADELGGKGGVAWAKITK